MEICNDDVESVGLTAASLSEGGVVVVPTDTVYGLAALPTFPDAIGRIFEMKNRSREVELPLIIGDVAQLEQLGVLVPPAGQRLIEAFWPGALTVIFGFDDRRGQSQDARPGWLAGRAEVAVRLPDHRFLQQLAVKVGPLAVTSANLHGQPTATDAQAAVESLTDLPDVVVDGGSLTATPSTLVNVRLSPARVEREGTLSAESLLAVAGSEAPSPEQETECLP